MITIEVYQQMEGLPQTISFNQCLKMWFTKPLKKITNSNRLSDLTISSQTTPIKIITNAINLSWWWIYFIKMRLSKNRLLTLMSIIVQHLCYIDASSLKCTVCQISRQDQIRSNLKNRKNATISSINWLQKLSKMYRKV